MSMKNLLAQMDAIEKGKKYIAESAAPVVEYKGGTDAEKIKNWQKHIDQFKEKGMYKAADDAEKSAKKAQPGFKPARSTDKPAKEGMGSIARALMQDMGIDEADARAQYDQFKADDARKAAVAKVKAMIKPGGQGVERLQAAIDPKTGLIYYGQEGGEGGPATPTPTPYQWYTQGQDKEFYDMLKTAGLEVVDKGGYAAVDPQKLVTIDQPPAPGPTPPAPGPTPPAPGPTPPAPGPIVNPVPPPTPVNPVDIGTDTKPPVTSPAVDPAQIKRFQELLKKAQASRVKAPAAESRSYDNDTLSLIKGMKL